MYLLFNVAVLFAADVVLRKKLFSWQI